MAHRMARRIEAFELNCLTYLNHLTRSQATIHAWDLVPRIYMRQYLSASCRNHLLVAAGVIGVLMGVENLRDGPPLGLGSRETFLMI